jgi:hypothetical protein
VEIVAELIEAVRTGHCDYKGPEEPPVISPGGLRLLTERNLWPRAMRAIIEIEKVHPRACRRFHRSWPHNGWMVRALVGDDDIYFKALRLLLPPWRGGAKLLWRGQLAGMWVGPSWTSNFMVAEEFAFHGVNVHWGEDHVKGHPDYELRIPRHLMLRPLPNRRPVILQATMRDEIISKLPNYDYKENEFIVDPRGVAYESFGIADLPDPRI